MAERQWTPRQRDAIEARGGTVLVSAAAGSGKTAVLVERAVGRILDSEQPVDADRLLVVTFSNAAALEMKQRIMARVTALAAEHPENARLRRQQLLLGRAQISTIHAFCSELIRQNFQLLGIASNIRTGDEKELEVLRRDCARGVVEEFFAREDGGRFARLVELLSTGRDDSRVFTTLFSLYDFVRSHPFYHGWMEAKLSYYNEGVPVADSIWGKCILGYAADALGHACALCGRALSLVEEDETLSNAYGGALRADLRQLERVRESVAARDWDGTCKRLGSFVFEKLRPVRGDDPRKGAAQALRKSVRGIVETLRDRQFCATAAEFSEDVADLRPMVETLFELVEAFDRAFTEQKRQKNLMDFSDMEQYAIALLVRPAGEGYVKTPLARAVSERYDEVLVDEFQDTNAAQEIIFRAVSQKERNLFLVGDVKQSIYRFRQACPELFMEKKKRYAPYDGKQFPAKITLGKNFRSAPEVTGSINFLFSLLMSEEIGEIDYNEEEALIPGGSFPEGTPAGCGLRLLDLTGYAGERTRAQVEADYVADEIAGMLGRGELVAEGDALRKIRPSDVCILLRSPSGRAQTYLEALQKRGVPVWAEPKSGFLTSKEVAPVVALLRVIDNPLLDVDLAAAMMSALFDFTADEMAHIRLADRRAPLYTAVQRRAGEGDAHCLEFCGTLARLRRFAAGATADAVIRRVYDECGCLAKAQVMRMGASRRANLLLLVQYACDYHASGYRGLSGFVGFVDRLIERGGDFAPAASLSEQAEVVRIMSIHRSKGLEFPVVFLCDCAKQFNRQDLNGTTLLHTELGFACVRRDPKLQTQFSTVPMQALRLAIERSMLSEELRVLYVALTRAKQRLILTGTLTRPGEKLAGLACAPEGNGKLPPYQVRGAASYLDWVLMAAVHHPGAAGLLAQYGVEAGAVPAQAAFSAAVLPVGGDPPAAGETAGETPPPPDPALTGALERRLAWRYPFAPETRIPTKMAVSQISKGELANSYRFAGRPAFLQERGLTAAQRGSALHKFMQFSDYRAAAKDVAAELERMAREGFLSRQEAEAIDAGKLAAFFRSPLAGRIFRADRVWRELRFLAEVGRETLGAYTDLFDAGGKTAVQGVADCVFAEDGGAVIVDYKTDHVRTPAELVERYRVQLELYRKVLGGALGMPVRECVLYSFALSREIII